MRPLIILGSALILAYPLAASAKDAPLCSDRPGKATPSCVVASGTLQVETSIIDWTHDVTGGMRSDMLLFGDTLVKYGIGSNTEARIEFTPYIRSRTRTPAGGVSIADGFGDVGLSVRHRFIDGGSAGASISAQPFITLPVGGNAVSSGTVSGGLTVPIDVPLPGGWALNATPTVAAAADSSGDGRHLTYSGVVAVTHGLTGNLSATTEVFIQRDRDPLGHTTQSTLDFLLAWQPIRNWQFDVSSYVGLNRDTPDVELLGGFTRRF